MPGIRYLKRLVFAGFAPFISNLLPFQALPPPWLPGLVIFSSLVNFLIAGPAGNLVHNPHFGTILSWLNQAGIITKPAPLWSERVIEFEAC